MEHDTESEGCWCGPAVLQPCPECTAEPAPDCWRCGGEGLVDAFDADAPVVIVHNATDDILRALDEA